MAQALILAVKRYSFDNSAMSDGEVKAFIADYYFDLLAGKQFIFVYSKIIEYQHIGDTKLH